LAQRLPGTLEHDQCGKKKLKVDKFSQLASLDSVVVYVDGFCGANTEASAAVGAIRFLDEFTSDIKKD
jgi:hypothetical protein